MQILNYNSFMYVFVGIVASAGIYFSYKSGEGSTNFFTEGKSSFWVFSMLSLFAGSLFQFWIILLPVSSLSFSVILIVFSLFISILLPILIVKNKYELIVRFLELLSVNLRTMLFAVVIIFFLLIQPFALLYLGEKVVRYFGGSTHFLMVFLIGTAGLSTLIGGKKVVVYANALFGLSVFVSMIGIMYLGKSLSAPLIFLQSLFSEGMHYFRNHNGLETNWIVGFIGFSVITWWMWWIDNSAIHLQEKQSEHRYSRALLFASFSLIVIAFVVLFVQSSGEIPMLDGISASSILADNELSEFFFAIGFISVMVSAFSQSFHTIAAIVVVQFFNDQIQHGVEEKHVLVARLTIVLSALLTILYIPFAHYFGAATLAVYIQYLSCFAASMVGVFTVFFLGKDHFKNGVTAGIVGGMSAGSVVALLSYNRTEIFLPFLTTPYGAATAVFFFSIACSIGGSVVVERRMTKRSVPV